MHSFFVQRHTLHRIAFVCFGLLFGIVLAFLFGLASAGANASQAYAAEAHALLYEDGTLVFQNSAADETDEGVVDIPFDTTDVYTAESLPPWNAYSDSVTEIVVADSITPATGEYFFYGMSACKSMDIEKLNCKNCHYQNPSNFQGGPQHMFDGCSSLVSLYLPDTFPGPDIYDIRSMFNGCKSLVSVDLMRSYNNSFYFIGGSIVDEYDFADCTSLRYIASTENGSWTGNNFYDTNINMNTISIDIPKITGKTWYYCYTDALRENPALTSAFPQASAISGLGDFAGYTANDPLPLSECDLEVGWEDGSPDYYVATGESYPDSYDLPVGAKLNESLDYTLGAYFDADCTVSAPDYSENAVYYFKADQVTDYVAFEGSTDVVASMKPVTPSFWGGDGFELVLDDAVSFEYYFGDLTPSFSSSNSDLVAVTYEDEGSGFYAVTLTPDAPTSDPVTITLSCTTGDATELSTSFDVTVAGERTSIEGDDFAVSIDALTYRARSLTPQVSVTNTQTGDALPESSYDLTYYSDSSCENEVVVRNAGTYWVKVEGKNRYEGTKVQEFEVAKATPTLTYYDPNNTFIHFLDPQTPLDLTYGQTWQTQTATALSIGYEFVGSDTNYGDVVDYEITTVASVDGVEAFYEKPTEAYYTYRGNLIVTPYTMEDFYIEFALHDHSGNYNDVTTPLYFTVSAASLTSADITATLNDAVYNGTPHIPDVTVTLGDNTLKDSDYELIYYSDEACQNVVSADDLVNVGTYYVKASGIGNYSGMTSAASFSIEKADGSLSVDPTTLDLDTEEGAGEVSVVYIGDGEIVVTSSDESIATATYENGVVTVTPVAAGTASISISAGEGTNYNAVSAVVVEVTVSGTSPEPQPTPEPGPAEPKDMTVYAGADRWQTANLIAAEVAEYGSYSGVIVCSGVNGKYADALSASGLSGVLDYPIVLTDGSLDGLDVDTASAVSALLGNSKGDILILGGENTVSAGIESGLSAYGSVERVAGDDRYATSQAVYDYGSANGTWSDDYAVIAIGNNFPDALGAASFCTSQGVPMLLTNRDSATLESYVQGAVSDVGEIVIAGGTTSIPDNKISNLKNTVRLAGDDRYATNLKFADWALQNGMALDGAGVATGTSFPDSLGSSYLLSITDSVLLLSSPTDNSALYDLLSQNADDINAVSVFGGENSVPTEVREAIQNAVGGEWQVTTK